MGMVSVQPIQKIYKKYDKYKVYLVDGTKSKGYLATKYTYI